MSAILVSALAFLLSGPSPYGLLPTDADRGFPPAGWVLVNVESTEVETRFLLEGKEGWKVTLFVTEREEGASAFALSARHALNYKVEAAPKGENPDSFPPVVATLVEAAAEAMVAGEEEGRPGLPQARDGSVDAGDSFVPETLLGGVAGSVPELSPGFRFRAVSIEGARIRFRFDHPYGGRLDLWVAPRSAGHKGYADTDYLTLWYDLDREFPKAPEALAELDRFLEEAVAKVRRSDSGEWAGIAPADLGPGQGEGPPRPEGSGGQAEGRGDAQEGGGTEESGPGRDDASWLAGRPVETAAALTAFLSMLLSLVSCWKASGAARRTLAGAGRKEWITVLAVTAAGAVRLVLVPLAPVKVGMVFPMLEQALRMEGLPRYGAGGAVLVHLLFRILRAHLDELLRFHSLLALVMPVLGAAAARRLFPRPGVAGFAAFYLALTPLFLRDGNTESLLVPGFFLFLVGFLLLWDSVQEGRWGSGLAALPALVAGASMRPEILVLAVLVTSLFLARATGRRRLACLGLALVVLLAPGIVYLVLATVREVAGDNLTLDRLKPGFIARNLVLLNVLAAPGAYPLSLSLLGGLGAWWAVRSPAFRKTGLVLLVLVAGWLALLAVDLNEESMLRLEVPAAMIWAVLAAFGSASLLSTASSPRARLNVTAALVAAFVASSLPGVDRLFRTTNSQEDSRVFHAAVERLPPGRVRLVVLTAEDLPDLAIPDPGAVGVEPPAGHVPVHRQLPLYRLHALRPDVEVVSVSRLRAGLPRDSRTFFYLGASCYAYRNAGGQAEWGVPLDPPPALHPACRYVLESHRVSRLYLERVPNRMEEAPAFHWYPDSLQAMTLGLIELEATSPSGRPQDPWASLGDECNREARPLIMAGALDRAVETLSGCERLFPDSLTVAEHLSSALYLRGTRQDERRDLEGAFHRLARVASGDPGRPQVLSRLGSVYFFYSKFRTDREMEEELDARLASDPADLVGLYLKGLFLFYARRDYAASEGYFLQVLERKKDEPRVFVYLALDAFYRGRQEEAEAWIGRGVDLAPEIEDPDVYYVRSIIIRLKDLGQAARDIERYLELTEGPDRVRHPTKQAWLRQELENLRAGRPSDWWKSREPTEPWVE